MTTLAKYEGVATKVNGSGVLVPMPSADVEVRVHATGSLASIYSDEAGSTPITNPATALADSEGRFKFYVAGVDRGLDITVTSGSDTYTIQNVSAGDAAQIDQSAVELKSEYSTDGWIKAGSGGSSVLMPPPMGFNIVGGYLEWSVSGNVLTVALKAWSGNDPSASEPVFIPFRNQSAGSAPLNYRKVIAATSIGINNTATMGAANATPFRLWAVAMDDGGTVRLGLVNCIAGSSPTTIFPLRDDTIQSGTQEDNSSDNAGVIYTDGASVTSKPLRILGYGEWPSGLTTAGVWDTAPSDKVPFGVGMKQPGDRVQLCWTDQATGGSSSSTSLVDVSGASCAITPRSAANPVLARMNWQATQANAPATNNTANYAVLRGATTIGSGMQYDSQSNNGSGGLSALPAWERMDFPKSTSSQTYKLQHQVNSGSSSINTTKVNIFLEELMG